MEILINIAVAALIIGVIYLGVRQIRRNGEISEGGDSSLLRDDSSNDSRR